MTAPYRRHLACDADRTSAAFASRLHNATNPDAVRSDLMATVHDPLEPARVSLSLTGGVR